MTLEEYEKVREEKRKALQALKTEERKVTIDKDLESMKQLSNKKENLDVFIKVCMRIWFFLFSCGHGGDLLCVSSTYFNFVLYRVLIRTSVKKVLTKKRELKR